MRESVGNAYLTYIVFIFLGIVLLLLVTSFSYSKAFKAKNKIINVIEKYDGWNNEAEIEVHNDLHTMGYRQNTSYFNTFKCKSNDPNAIILYGDRVGNFHYCLFRHDVTKGSYYEVITYMHFDIPLIGSKVAVPVRGESRIVYQNLEG